MTVTATEAQRIRDDVDLAVGAIQDLRDHIERCRVQVMDTEESAELNGEKLVSSTWPRSRRRKAGTHTGTYCRVPRWGDSRPVLRGTPPDVDEHPRRLTPRKGLGN